MIDLVEERRDLFDPFSSTSTETGENGSRRRKRAFVPVSLHTLGRVEPTQLNYVPCCFWNQKQNLNQLYVIISYLFINTIKRQGCGKGYDVVMLALHGFDVWGLDISETGVQVAREYAKAELANPQAYNFGKHWGGNENETTTPGKVTFIAGDFFDRAWEAGIPQDESESESGSESGLIQFDLIYDYTVSLPIIHTLHRHALTAGMYNMK